VLKLTFKIFHRGDKVESDRVFYCSIQAAAAAAATASCIAPLTGALPRLVLDAL
jgi:hypothetical protein